MTSQPAYLVICGRIEFYCAERNVPDMSRESTVRDIADMQFENLHSVIEVGTGRDVTAELVGEAMDLRADRGSENSYGFAKLVELTLGTRTARPLFVRAA